MRARAAAPPTSARCARPGPTPGSGPQRREERPPDASFGCGSVFLALQSPRDPEGIACEFGTVDVAWAGQGDVEYLRNAPRRRRHAHDAVAQAHGLAHV